MIKKIIVATALCQVVTIAIDNIPTEARNTLNQIIWRLNADGEITIL